MMARTHLQLVGIAFSCVSLHAQVIVQRPDIQHLGLAGPPPLIAPQPPAASVVQFDVVSIKPSPGGTRNSTVTNLPDGGLRAVNRAMYTLIALAYPPALPVELVGVPDWARTERYDVLATASLEHPTPIDRATMMRAMLADRLKLVVHFENREQDAFDLVLERKDGKLGSGLTRTETDCSQPSDAVTSASRPDPSAPPPPCTFRTTAAVLRKQGSELGDLLEGDAPIDRLADALRLTALRGRPVINKTGLAGSYHVSLSGNLIAAMMPPSATQPANDAPSLFTAIQEQLGLKLQPSRIMRNTLVIDHIERPTPNQ
jgi:uncharacterized protein (TIGR03435 family)